MKSNTLRIPYGDMPAEPSVPVACRNGWEGNDGAEEAFLSAVWNEDVLAVRFLTKNAPAVCCNFGDMSAVSDDSCVEVFIRPVDGGEYWNLEFNIAGFINASHRLVRDAKTPLTPDECASIARNAEPRVTTPDDAAGVADWTMEVRIPWSIIGVVPRRGLRMTANFYACAGRADRPYYLSWAPIGTPKPDFHRPEFFGEIVLD